jgi:thiopeptide-type bacteriocin biosynthesis protein
MYRDRVVLAERAPTSDGSGWGPAVSVRATRAVRLALTSARTPIPYEQLASELVSTSGATPEKVEALIDQLWEQTMLLTDLRPPLTVQSPARYVADRLAGIPAGQAVASGLERLLHAMEAWDSLPFEDGVTAYFDLQRDAHSLHASAAKPSVQVDMAWPLAGSHISATVAAEAARTAELLLKLTPSPRGPAYLQGYRRAFESRYGHERQVPLLEVLDPSVGLGPPPLHGHGAWAAEGMDPHRSALRQQTLHDLALTALRDRRQVVELEEQVLARLQTWVPGPATAPTSLDMSVFVLSRSREALDAGAFQLMVGPNLGASAVGRNLGRFADLLGNEAVAALTGAARTEAAHAPDRIWAEVTYLPHRLRSANVAIRPGVRDFEIAIGTSPGVGQDRLIPLAELMVEVCDGRLRVSWPTRGAEVIVCAGHMLNNMSAPPVVRFLEDVGRDGVAAFSSFDWGPAAGLPFLPRVQSGRIVLAPAQWRIDPVIRDDELMPSSQSTFADALGVWRDRWQVPGQVYLTHGDNRLLLDFNDEAQVEELRREMRRLAEGNAILLHEALPAPECVWAAGPGGQFITEIVVPLVLRGAPTRVAASVRPATADLTRGDSLIDRVRAPGSDWLYLKLYCPQNLEDDLIGGPLREFCNFAGAAGLAEEWFFLRYADPDNHLRLRFRGDPEDLVRRLVPEASSWAGELMAEGLCQRFSFDTYERELERYGGPTGTAAAESVFAADSRAVSAMLDLLTRRTLAVDRTAVAVLSIDDLLGGLGLDESERLAWYRRHVTSRHDAGTEYRRRQAVLRGLLGDSRRLAAEPGGPELQQVFAERRTTLAIVAKRLDMLAERGELGQDLDKMYRSYVHLHCNRLLGSGASTEPLVIGLLRRLREGLARAPLT